MGRTKRKRTRKKAGAFNFSLENEISVIELKRWLKGNLWRNDSGLVLKYFAGTGRGVVSYKNLVVNDVLIQVPYHFMISYTTVSQSELKDILLGSGRGLKMQDLLSLYLALERHKGAKSGWWCYLNSLPEIAPWLPVFGTPKEIAALPLFLRRSVEEMLGRFEASWARVEGSIKAAWRCLCCKKQGVRVITLNLYKWAYAMVNTRAVYTNPVIVREITGHFSAKADSFVSDAPSMALCPFLDMFNHSHKAVSDANLQLISGVWKYVLKTGTPCTKHEQIFISYGAHDNRKLFCEYGFFIGDNELDVVDFSLEEVLEATRAPSDNKQLKFVRDKQLNSNLHVSSSGLSFNLKAALYVLLNKNVPNWTQIIFSESYSEKQLKDIYIATSELLKNKATNLQREIIAFKRNVQEGDFLKNIPPFLEYQSNFIYKTKRFVDEHINEFT